MSETFGKVCGACWLSVALLAACSAAPQRTTTAAFSSPALATPEPRPSLDPPAADLSLVDVAPPLQPQAPPAALEELSGTEPAELEAPTEEGSSERLQAALGLYELATRLWSGGDLDATLELLDQAYSLMASVEPAGDLSIAQDKESLRQLLAKRILELYAVRRSGVGNEAEAIPLELNPEVEREILSFQTVERARFIEAYRRSGLYRPMILEELRNAGLPEGLSWLPLVESLFKERALSSARAAGLWQFIASTGYRYSLRRTEWIDERFDPLKSTRAAIAYLSDLHALFGDWLTALAAYNCGEGTILRELKRQPAGYFDRFWDLYARLPEETRRYVPRLIATLRIVQDPARYGFELPEPLTPPATETVEVTRSVSFEVLERHLGLAPNTLAELNPELRRNATPPNPYPLRLPAGVGSTLVASLESLPVYEIKRATRTQRSKSFHQIRQGETLSSIANRYGISAEALARANGIVDPRRLQVGQVLSLPARSQAQQPPESNRENGQVRSRNVVQYRVRPGDNLWSIADRFGVTVEQLKGDNRLVSNVLQPGQVLSVRSSG